MSDPRRVSEGITFDYDANYDVLYLSIGRPVPSYTDDEIDGVLIRRDFETDRLTGATIIGYRSKTKQFLKKTIPFYVDFASIDRHIRNRHVRSSG
ncbi:MAG: hypothetical protein NUW12_12085 [Firmicutes bacterium]|nr:hypothetical protein [Bacillota bacterium]